MGKRWKGDVRRKWRLSGMMYSYDQYTLYRYMELPKN